MYIYQKLAPHADYIINLYNNGVSTNKIAEMFDCNSGTVYAFLKSAGVDIRKRSLNYGNMDQYKDIIIQKHSEGLSSYQISKDINVPKASVLRYAKKIGLDFSDKYKLTNPIRMKDQEDLIKKLYESGVSGHQISKQLGYSPSQVTEFLNRLGYELTHVKYDSNIHFFDKIETEVQAYVLGFWYADGTVSHNTIRLAITDLDILERIRLEMGCNGPLHIKEPKNIKHKTQYCLYIGRKEIVSGLIRCGCHPNKTLTLKFPEKDIVPDHLVSHFIRGYIDGDGNIYRNKKTNNIRCQIVGTKEFLEGIERVTKTINVNCSWSKRHKDDKNNYNITIGGNIQALRFFDWLYKDVTIFLARKHQIYHDFRVSYHNAQQLKLQVTT